MPEEKKVTKEPVVVTDDREKIKELVLKQNKKYNKDGDVDAYLSLLTEDKWKMIHGNVDACEGNVLKAKAETWIQHDTIEKKAAMVGLFARHLIAPQATAKAVKA